MADAATPSTDLPRTVALSHDRVLIVRDSTAGDVDGLLELYQGLSADDLHRRFFSAFHPSREFLANWIAVAERGGRSLVAELRTGAEPRGRIVGEAGYADLGDQIGEFAITVEPEWRGWLGPYLLDALVTAAAERGVRRLEADILVENRRMLALVRARGYATVSHPDWTVRRVAIGTTSRIPDWRPRQGRPRVLVEIPGGRWYAEDAVREGGIDLLTCPGPEPGPGGRCPELRGEPCPLVSGADAIVVALPPGERTTALIDAHRALHPDTPVCVCGPEDAAVHEGTTLIPTRIASADAVALLQGLTGVRLPTADPDDAATG